jgi:murein DD-endopeptidase MepM/ murein hydrolase activator NlpD
MLTLLALLLSPVVLDTVRIRTIPERVFQDYSLAAYPNFDLLIENTTSDTLHVERLTVLAYDSNGRLVDRRFAAGPATALLLPARTIDPGEAGLLYQPFTFAGRPPLARLRYELLLTAADGRERNAVADVLLQPFEPATRLELPLKQRVLVDDGYDFLSHHRRIDWTASFAKPLKLSDNFQRFALDLCVVDSAGNRHRGSGTQNAEWFGWNGAVLAPAAGTVVVARDGQPDNEADRKQGNYDPRTILTDPMGAYGNHLVIDHGNGEFTLLGHLRNGSVRVRRGEHVEAGTIVAAVGNSGSALYPHLHFELRTGSGFGAPGLPPGFVGARRIASKNDDAVMFPNTGDLIEPR